MTGLPPSREHIVPYTDRRVPLVTGLPRCLLSANS